MPLQTPLLKKPTAPTQEPLGLQTQEQARVLSSKPE
jgi:hypothetical protein